MAELIYHIDEISRVQKRDVLWVSFEYPPPHCSIDGMPKRLSKRRNEIIFWLQQQKIYYEACFGIFSGALEEPYRGNFFVDLRLDRDDQNFVTLESMLEHTDGSSRIKGIFFFHLPLKVARKNGRFYREVMSGI